MRPTRQDIISHEVVNSWKSLLVSLNHPHRAGADLLLELYDEKRVASSDSKESPPSFRFTGDGLGVLSGLLTAGLIEISRRFLGAGFLGGGRPSIEVSLTKRGRRLVEAW
jgi:hypothetical protein